MAITTLRVTNFRNLGAIEVSPCQYGLNIICGNNGSGKTSLLEAIHYLGMGRSFRSGLSSRLIQYNADKFSIFSQLLSDNEQIIPIGVSRETNGLTQLRMAEKDLSGITEVAYFLPIRVINSQSHHLFESGPTFRRKFLDWGLFYQSESFLSTWRNYERALKQRNAGLREHLLRRDLAVWTDEVVKYGILFHQLRREYVQLLAPQVAIIAKELLDVENLSILYQPGWEAGSEYGDVLAASYSDDARLGYTQAGPHRADIEVTIDAIPVKHFLSRGQLKLLICAMILAQGMLLAKHANKRLIYLVDDLPSELDLRGRERLISLLARQQTQVFITAIESNEMCSYISDKLDVPMKVFHVEHGGIIKGDH